MSNRDDLQAAVGAEIISAAQADALDAFLSARSFSPVGNDAEEVHFVRGLHDILIALGLILFLAGLVPLGLGLLGLAAGWLLAEYFTARKRLVLPSIVLAVTVTLSGGLLGGLLSAVALDFGDVPSGVALSPPFLGAGFIAALLFYVRFRLPFALALCAAMLVCVFLSVLELRMPGFVGAHFGVLALVLGLVVFAAAMREDFRDPERRTLHADNAFWLHLLAAPAIIHGLIGQQFGAGATDGAAGAAMVLGTMGVVTIVALLIDRRALLVSGLGYFAAALGTVMQTLLASGDDFAGLTLTPLLVGAIVLIIGVGWAPFRRALLPLLPPALSTRIRPAPAD
ncbi:MAG: hypothetical protein COA62_13365 [Rhodobiaceae bacterium]|nr:MAG: hypothetical protein COA62_13365 [Rhodobiaceae bacterium]